MIIRDLILLANRLDNLGLAKEADIVDEIILKSASANVPKENLIRKCFVESVSPEQITFAIEKIMDLYKIKYSSIDINNLPEANGSVIATIYFEPDNHYGVKREDLISHIAKTKISEKISLAVDYFASNFTTYLERCKSVNLETKSSDDYCIKLKSGVSSGIIFTNIVNGSPCSFSIEVSKNTVGMV